MHLNINSLFSDFTKLLTWVVLARSITVLLGILTSIIIGRYYGPTALGILAIVISIYSIESAISLSLSYILIPQYGAVGAALSVAFSTILLNLLLLIFIYRRFGVLSCYIPFLKLRNNYEKIKA